MKPSALLGIKRVADIIVNVVLPLASAWSKLTFQTELTGKVFALYGNYPRLVVNAVGWNIRHQLRLSSFLCSSAQHQ